MILLSQNPHMAQLHMLVSALWAGFWPKATAWCGLAACCGGWTPWRGDPSSGLARPSRWPNGAKCVAGRSHHGQRRHGVTGSQGSPTDPLCCGRWHGHEDDERSTPGKKNDDAPHRGGGRQ
jgi:hypothetical protein